MSTFTPVRTFFDQTIDPNKEIQKLPLLIWNRIVNLLNIGEGWLQLAETMTTPEGKAMFSAEHIQIMKQPGQNPSELLLKHISTVGKKPLNTEELLNFLMRANLISVANYISVDVLKRAPVVKTVESLLAELQIDPTLEHLPFTLVAKLANNFNNVPYKQGGNKLGEGGFGSVYFGKIGERCIAIKKLNSVVDKSFSCELKSLQNYKHENLVTLLYYSFDGPHSCLVYEFISNGSLEELLKGGNPPLLAQQRTLIVQDVACGINYLHTFKEQPLIHRDIKTANILLDNNLVAKVGDFGLARTMQTTSDMTSTVIGTSPYMAPEMFHGEISVYTDVFSYGVVLFELLTGLSALDDAREEKDLVSHILENCEDIRLFLDQRAGEWIEDGYNTLYKLGLECTAYRKRERPTMLTVINTLKTLEEC